MPAYPGLDTIVEHTNQLGAMIEALMNFSRLNAKPLALQPMLPTEVVRQVFEELSANEIGRCIKLDVAELPVCQADPQLMRLVWRELVHYALKWTRGRDVAQITVGFQHANGVVVYCVSDNGTGFDMRYSGRLFGLFQRLHADYSLPHYDALRALEYIKASALDIPFIIVSGTIGEECAVDAMRQGATDYLLKDRLSRLSSAVSNALEQRRLRQKQLHKPFSPAMLVRKVREVLDAH